MCSRLNLAYRNDLANGDVMNKCLNCGEICEEGEDFCCESCENEYFEGEDEEEDE